MPQFTADPNQPGSIYYDTARLDNGRARWGQVAYRKTNKGSGSNGGKNKDSSGGSQSGGTAPVTSAPASTPAKDTSRGKNGKGGKGGKGNKGDKGKKPAYNPIYEPFLTPNEIRKQAQELAAMTVPSEQAIQQQYAAEQAGIQGLTGALSARLGDIAAQQTAGLAGFGDMYGRLASGAQAAGQSAAAAAGAPTTIAAGATPTMAPELMRRAYAVTGYQPAAVATGARLGAESLANLRKSLVDRASQISVNAAKYVQSLTDRELQRAITQETAKQNAARLNLQVGQEAWNQKMDVAKLQQANEALRIRGQALQLQVQKAAQQYAKGTPKSIAAAQNSLMENALKYTSPQKQASGLYEFQIQVPSMDSMGNTTYKTQTIQAVDQKTANAMAQQAGGSGATMIGPAYTDVAPTRAQAMSRMIGVLAPYMGQKRARNWVMSNSTALGLDSLA